MDKVISRGALALVFVAAGLGAAGCGTQDPRTVGAAPSVSDAPSAAPTDAVPPPPGDRILARMHDVGIEAVGDHEAAGMAAVSFSTALDAARADNGGLTSNSTFPASAWFGRLNTPHFGTTLGTGDAERVVPALAGTKGWVLVFEDAIVPAAGGRGPQFPPTAVPGEQTAAEPSAVVDLVVVIDGLTGEFLFARALTVAAGRGKGSRFP